MNTFDITKKIYILNNVLQSHLTNMLKEYNISHLHARILICINNNQGINQKLLAEELQISKTQTATKVKELNALDLLSVKKNENDERNNLLYISKKAKELIVIIEDEINKYDKKLLNQLSDFNIKNLDRNINHVINNAFKIK